METKKTIIVTSTIAGIGLLSFFGFKALKNLKEKRRLNKDFKAYSTSYDASTGKKVKKGTKEKTGASVTVNLAEITDRIARNLGTSYSGWNPQAWTENDTEAYNAILEIPLPLVNKVVELYKNKYKRNLVSDLSELLDAEYWEKVKNRFV